MQKFKYVEVSEEVRKKFHVIIKADSNDADYITEDEYYSLKEFEEIVDELKNLQTNYSGHHELEDYESKFDLPIPYSDWGRCHTIESIDITYLDESGKLWEVELI